jgi:signal transduction histidine kinase
VSRIGRRTLWRWWPRSLFGRVALILFLGLAAAHALTFSLVLEERGQASLRMMISYLAKDIATSVAILDRVPAGERPLWVGRIERPNYRYVLGAPAAAMPDDSPLARQVTAAVANALGPGYGISATLPTDAGDPALLRVNLRLADGTPLAIDMSPPSLAISPWVAAVLCAQLFLLAVVTWIAVRVATRPLAQLAKAADELGLELNGKTLSEDGPIEVSRAAVAFNLMQRRIADHVAERLRMLAAISHDLQTPITRMRLRADLLESAQLRDKLQADLDAMQMLVHEGIAFARSAQGITEPACRVDLNALLDSLVCDYVDGGERLTLAGHIEHSIVTRPHALRRIVVNLVDNALKFGRDVGIEVGAEARDHVLIAVRDRGPGIPPAELSAVLQPFYRLESSRNRDTGGAGLGLAIAHQLARALGGSLTLANRAGGGLEARLLLPLAEAVASAESVAPSGLHR